MGKPGRALRAAGWVAVGAVAAGGVATAATTTASTSKISGSAASTTASVVPAAGASAGASKAAGAKRGLAGRIGKLQGRLLHGDFTVEGKDGKPVNVAEQRGTVNAVSSTSITLTSKDGFNHTYVIDSSTRVRVDGKKGAITGVKTGQDATVLAKVSGSTETAAIVVQRAAK